VTANLTAQAPNSSQYRRPWLAPYQLSAIFGPKRFGCVEATTKAGKTAGCLVWKTEQAIASRDGRNHWWVAPVYAQAEIAYRRMKRGLPRPLFRSNDSERWIRLANGAMIWFKSAEKPDNLYGDDVFSLVVDEASRVSRDAFVALRTTITATKGSARFIGNVKGRGNWFYRMCRNAERGLIPYASYAKITWRDAVEAGILDAAEIDQARNDLSESEFSELYEANAAELIGRVYRDFSPENLSLEISDPGGDVLIGMDFNVDPMTAVVASRVADQLHVWEEIVLQNSNTAQMIAEIESRLPRWIEHARKLEGVKAKTTKRRVIVYPDPAGKQRRSSAPLGQTDLSLLRGAGFEVRVRSSAPPVVDRINEVNALAKNAAGVRRLFVNPKGCPKLTESLSELTYKEGTSQPDPKAEGESGIELIHIADGLGYLVHEEFPIVSRSGVGSTVGLLGV
jgi:hypothetical protein